VQHPHLAIAFQRSGCLYTARACIAFNGDERIANRPKRRKSARLAARAATISERRAALFMRIEVRHLENRWIEFSLSAQ